MIEMMTIVHSEAPWGQPQEERLAPKERTHPMRPLSRNNNTTTRLKRGPNPLSGVLILVLIFLIYFRIFFLYFLKIFFVIIIIFYLFIFLYCFFFFFFCILYLYLYLYFFFFFFISALICCTPGDNHNKPSSPQATERS